MGEVAVGNTIVSWREFNFPTSGTDGTTNVMIIFNSATPQVATEKFPNECIPAMTAYRECARARGELILTRKQAIAAATQAIAAHPTCSWSGFDPVHDAKVRSNGLAAYDDNRFLFAQLKC